ncbi:hypothetical protein PIB30_088055 [Stylosanthes scabra]|uniref:Uncharacterized protein n=1 Tax=Stylosanthes scabra TaxID=79078 RepID=A0ABU6QTN2_9FABA|nr:hypothetical protein [Stylosanthes scabra]
MERTKVVMDAVVAGNSASVAGVSKEREIEVEMEDRRERDATRREEEEGSAGPATPIDYRFSDAIRPSLLMVEASPMETPRWLSMDYEEGEGRSELSPL